MIPPVESVETIAGKLTSAQREWLLAQMPTLEPVDVEPCAEWWDGPRLYVTIDAQDYWIGSRNMTSPAGESTFTSGETKLTPLGLEVRTLLQRNSTNG